MENFSSTDQDFNLMWLLSQAKHAAFKVRQKELDRYNISIRQAAVLFIIQAIGDKVTPAQIAWWLFREPHTVSGVLSRMEKKGLVRRVKDLHKKNLIRVVITEKGREAYYQSTKRESVSNIISSLSEEERQQLKSYLQTIRDKAMKALGIEYELPFPPSQ